jgi:hypothetical protein
MHWACKRGVRPSLIGDNHQLLKTFPPPAQRALQAAGTCLLPPQSCVWGDTGPATYAVSGGLSSALAKGTALRWLMRL